MNLLDLIPDKQVIDQLQGKYLNLLRNHMKLKKPQRDKDWEAKRRMLFHIQGALSMAQGAFASYTKHGL